MAAAEPQIFWAGLRDHVLALGKPIAVDSKQLIRVFCANPSSAWPVLTDDKMSGYLEIVVMFFSPAARKLQGRGFVHYMPQHLSQWSKHIAARAGGVDVFWGSCSIPDKRGFVSLGTSNCYESEVLRIAKKVVLEINPHMPATHGATEVSLDEVDAFVMSDAKLPEVPPSSYGAGEETIADYVVSLIPDRATLQLGIGGIPNAIGKKLAQKKDLGIHTEMINDAVLELYKQGAITGLYKTIWPRKIVGAFAYGSEQLYEFIRDNPIVEIHPASVVNDLYRIGRNHRMISINSAVEIDMTGQVCSESLGHLELSGVGGAAETHIGAQRSEGGRGIIAMPSTTKDGAHSKIVACLQPGAKVSVSRNDIDTVVTEYGIAELKGKTVPERIRSMIKIAHPKFQKTLFEHAKTLSYI
jgi:acyl-CoA hydrolase